MRRAQSQASQQSRPNRRFRRRIPAAAAAGAAAALIAAAPVYAAVNPLPSRPAVAAPAAKQPAVTLNEIFGGGTQQTIGSKR
jgi:hypothetical protein